MDKIEMILGERRAIEMTVTACDGEPFIIRDPTYVLWKGDVAETTGEPILENESLVVTIEPQTVGKYILEFTVKIAEEVIIKRFPVYVRD